MFSSTGELSSLFNAITRMGSSTSTGHPISIFFKVLALHWHGYDKEQVNNLNVLIDADERLGERCYPLQLIYLIFFFLI